MYSGNLVSANVSRNYAGAEKRTDPSERIGEAVFSAKIKLSSVS